MFKINIITIYLKCVLYYSYRYLYNIYLFRTLLHINCELAELAIALALIHEIKSRRQSFALRTHFALNVYRFISFTKLGVILNS